MVGKTSESPPDFNAKSDFDQKYPPGDVPQTEQITFQDTGKRKTQVFHSLSQQDSNGVEVSPKLSGKKRIRKSQDATEEDSENEDFLGPAVPTKIVKRVILEDDDD